MSKQLQQHNLQVRLTQESVFNHYHTMYFVLFVIGERLHHYLLTITKEKSKPTEEGQSTSVFHI